MTDRHILEEKTFDRVEHVVDYIRQCLEASTKNWRKIASAFARRVPRRSRNNDLAGAGKALVAVDWACVFLRK
jgi:hypothetical protein